MITPSFQRMRFLAELAEDDDAKRYQAGVRASDVLKVLITLLLAGLFLRARSLWKSCFEVMHPLLSFAILPAAAKAGLVPLWTTVCLSSVPRCG